MTARWRGVPKASGTRRRSPDEGGGAGRWAPPVPVRRSRPVLDAHEERLTALAFKDGLHKSIFIPHVLLCASAVVLEVEVDVRQQNAVNQWPRNLDQL